MISKYYEEGVNVIVPCFGVPAPIEIVYHGKPIGAPVVICLSGPVPYESDKAVPYKYNATILEDGVEVPIQTLSDVKNIAEANRVAHSGGFSHLSFEAVIMMIKRLLKGLNLRKKWGNLVALH